MSSHQSREQADGHAQSLIVVIPVTWADLDDEFVPKVNPTLGLLQSTYLDF